MNTSRFYFLSVVTLVMWPLVALPNIVIDNFSTGATNRIQVICGVKDQTQVGTMAGGTRRDRLIVNLPGTACNGPNLYRQTASMQVRNGGPLILNSDFRVFHRLELSYGQDEFNNYTPLNLDLTEGGLNNRRIRVTFAAMDLVENFNIVLFMHDGSARSACGINVSPKTTQFSIDFPLANFSVQLGIPDYTDVDFMAFIYQSGSAMGSNDFAIKSVSVTSDTSPGIEVASCA